MISAHCVSKASSPRSKYVFDTLSPQRQPSRWAISAAKSTSRRAPRFVALRLILGLRRPATVIWRKKFNSGPSSNFVGGTERGYQLKPELITRRCCIVIKGLDRIARIFDQVPPVQRQLSDQIVGHRDNVAADFIGLKQVQDFAWAGP